jgi:hypothetical protein
MPAKVTFTTISAGADPGYGFNLALDTAGRAWAR